MVDRRVGEAHHRTSRDAPRRGRRQTVGQDGAAVPEAVTVGAVPILPAIAPERGGQHQDGRGMGQRRLTAAGFHHRATVIARPQGRQGETVRSEVIDTRIEVRQRPRDHVDVDMVQGAGAGRSPEEHFAAEIAPAAGDPGAEEQELAEILPGDLAFAFRNGPGYRLQRGNVGRRQMLLQRQGVEVLVDLEGVGLIVPVEVMRAAADAHGRVLGALVIVPRGRDVSISHGASRILAEPCPVVTRRSARSASPASPGRRSRPRPRPPAERSETPAAGLACRT